MRACESMAPLRKYTEEAAREMARAFTLGVTTRRIALAYDTDHSTVTRLIRRVMPAVAFKMGPPVGQPCWATRQHDPIEVDLMIAAYESGASVTAIAKAFHCSTCTVRTRFWERGEYPVRVVPRRIRRWNYERRSTPKASIHPTIRDLEWAAGFLEGDGSFPQHRSKVSSVTVTAVQVNPLPLQRLVRLFGGNLTMRYRSRRNQHWSDVHVWVVAGMRAIGVMFTLYPLLSSVRQAQIRQSLRGA